MSVVSIYDEHTDFLNENTQSAVRNGVLSERSDVFINYTFINRGIWHWFKKGPLVVPDPNFAAALRSGARLVSHVSVFTLLSDSCAAAGRVQQPRGLMCAQRCKPHCSCSSAVSALFKSIHVFCSGTNPQKWFSERVGRLVVSRSPGFLWLSSGKKMEPFMFESVDVLSLPSYFLGDGFQDSDACSRGSLFVPVFWKRGFSSAHWLKCSFWRKGGEEADLSL